MMILRFQSLYIYIYVCVWVCVCVCVCVSTCQTHSYDFWIINAMCTFMYLFVVYFSFAPVISASIHRYVNYFDIHILMMVTETETLTSTLHHNIFTYFDYVFCAPFIMSDFNPYLLSYIYIYDMSRDGIYLIEVVEWFGYCNRCRSIEQVLRSHIHEYGHVRNRHVMFITIEHIKDRNLKNT